MDGWVEVESLSAIQSEHMEEHASRSPTPRPRRERWKQIKYGIARQGEVWWVVCNPGRYGSREGPP